LGEGSVALNHGNGIKERSVNKARKKIETLPWNPADYLRTNEEAAQYLEAALQIGEPALVTAVLDDIVRAKMNSRS
jgi:DNA-binding phage protein